MAYEDDKPNQLAARGLCMYEECCRNRTTPTELIIGEDELTEHRYTNVELCRCGLPAWHLDPSPEFIAQYNARPVPHRILPDA